MRRMKGKLRERARMKNNQTQRDETWILDLYIPNKTLKNTHSVKTFYFIEKEEGTSNEESENRWIWMKRKLLKST